MTTSNTYYTLDGTNNRRLVYSVLSFPPPPDNYILDDTVPPADEQMNQYTQTPFDERTYDESGNLLTWTDGSTIDYEAAYDYRNQMISVFDDVTDETTDYRYDALGRRIERDVDGAVTRYYSFGWRVVEEQDGDDDTVATYVYGNYIDEPLQMRRDLGEGMEDFYYHQDDMYNVMALTDDSGAVVERYDYKDYGEPIVYNGNGQVISGTAYGNPYLFNGRRYDPETGFYYYRTRYLDPKVGRFTTRDTIGIWGDPANLGNGYAYVGNNPWRWLDPLGMECVVTPGGRTGSDPYTAPDMSNIPSEFWMVAFAMPQELKDEACSQLIAEPLEELVTSLEEHDVVGGAWAACSLVPNPLSKGVRGAKATMRCVKSGKAALGCTDETVQVLRRYVGPGEATVIRRTGKVPNVNVNGTPKGVFYTPDDVLESACDAKKAYQLSQEPTHVVSVRAIWEKINYAGNVDGGSGIEATTTEEFLAICVEAIKKQQ